MIISYSELAAFQKCRRSYYYKYSLGYAPIKEGDPIKKGKMGHRMLQTFYEKIMHDATKDEAINAIMDDMPKHYRSDLNVLKVWAIVKNYLETVNVDKIEPVFVERVFKFQLVEAFGLWVGFTPDNVWRYSGGFLCVEDYKFVGKMWSEKRKSRYTQLPLYKTWLREMGENVSTCMLRFFNVDTGKVDVKNYDPSPVRMRAIQREFILAAIELQEFKSKPVAEQQSLAIRTLSDIDCQYCPFSYPCNLELDGKDASKTFLNEFVANDYGYEQ